MKEKIFPDIFPSSNYFQIEITSKKLPDGEKIFPDGEKLFPGKKKLFPGKEILLPGKKNLFPDLVNFQIISGLSSKSKIISRLRKKYFQKRSDEHIDGDS